MSLQKQWEATTPPPEEPDAVDPAQAGIAAADDFFSFQRQYDEVYVPAMGKRVRVRGMTLAEHDEYDTALARLVAEAQMSGKQQSTMKLRARILGRCIVDGTGRPLFPPLLAERLGNLDGAVLEPIWDAIRRLSGIDAAKEDDALKNALPPVPLTDFGSDSPSPLDAAWRNSETGSPSPSGANGSPISRSSRSAGTGSTTR